jgi:hypothetical protein
MIASRRRPPGHHTLSPSIPLLINYDARKSRFPAHNNAARSPPRLRWVINICRSSDTKAKRENRRVCFFGFIFRGAIAHLGRKRINSSIICEPERNMGLITHARALMSERWKFMMMSDSCFSDSAGQTCTAPTTTTLICIFSLAFFNGSHIKIGSRFGPTSTRLVISHFGASINHTFRLCMQIWVWYLKTWFRKISHRLYEFFFTCQKSEFLGCWNF